MLSMSRVITSIKMDLGVYGLSLPFDNPDEALRNVIKIKTLPTFSQFSPQYMTFTIDTNELEQHDDGTYQSKVFTIPDMFGDRDILYVRSLDVDTSELADGYVDPIYIGNELNYEDLISAQASANLLSLAIPSVTFKFYPPNKLEIFNAGLSFDNKFKVTVALEHSENLTTIPKTSWTSFMKLATLDVKKFLYDNLKLYGNLQTAYGNIDIKIDDWANAEQERNDLVNQWEDVWHLDDEQFIII